MAVYPARAGIAKMPESGIRAFDIGRDLRPVAELIANAFAHELDQRGTSALREMRVMSHFGSVIKLVNRSTGEFDDYFGGFIWMEEGKVVGNVTVQRAERSGSRWQIANVAVAPAYRGRGISRQLMERALAHIVDEGGKFAVLQVYENNHVARSLYQGLGFEEMSGAVELRLNRAPLLEFQGSESGIEAARIPNFYSFSVNHWQPLYELANSQLGDQSQWWRAIRRTDFQLTFEQQLGEWFWQSIGSQRIFRRCIQTHQRFDAALILTASRWQGTHKLQMWVRPENYGKYEAQLLHWIFDILQDYPRLPVHITMSKGHQAGLELFQQAGFKQHRTLLTMRKEM